MVPLHRPPPGTPLALPHRTPPRPWCLHPSPHPPHHSRAPAAVHLQGGERVQRASRQKAWEGQLQVAKFTIPIPHKPLPHLVLPHRPHPIPHHPHPLCRRNPHQRRPPLHLCRLQDLHHPRAIRKSPPVPPYVAAPQKRRPLFLRLERRRHHPCGQPALLWLVPAYLYVSALSDVELRRTLQRPPGLRFAPERAIHHWHSARRPPACRHRCPTARQSAHPRPQYLLPPPPAPRPRWCLCPPFAPPCLLDDLHALPHGRCHPLLLPQPPHLRTPRARLCLHPQFLCLLHLHRLRRAMAGGQSRKGDRQSTSHADLRHLPCCVCSARPHGIPKLGRPRPQPQLHRPRRRSQHPPLMRPAPARHRPLHLRRQRHLPPLVPAGS